MSADVVYRDPLAGVRELAMSDERAATRVLVRGLMRGEKASFKQGWPVAGAVEAANRTLDANPTALRVLTAYAVGYLHGINDTSEQRALSDFRARDLSKAWPENPATQGDLVGAVYDGWHDGQDEDSEQVSPGEKPPPVDKALKRGVAELLRRVEDTGRDVTP